MTIRMHPVFANAILSILTITATASAQTGDVYGVHDPVLIREGDTYYLFATGSRRGETLRLKTSTDLVNWQQAEPPISELPAWTREAVPMVRSLWAPDICYFKDKYHLYYSASSFGSNTSAIGLMTNATLDPASDDFAWIDQGVVIASGEEPHQHFNAIDPHVVLDAEGQPWMSFGSFWSGIKLIRLDEQTGLWDDEDREIRHLSTRESPGAVEAPTIHRHGDHCYLFVSFDFCCRGVNSTYNLRVGRSNDIAGPYIDRDGVPLLDGGGTIVLETADRIIGPGHCDVVEDGDQTWLVHHFYDADANGRSALQIRPLTWDEAGWPIAGAPLGLPDPADAGERRP
jgi:arabinan endo-1,5-alpha-L-arabinosidase